MKQRKGSVNPKSSETHPIKTEKKSSLRDYVEGGERDKGAEILSEEIMAENFPKLGKETDIQIRGTQRDPHQDINFWCFNYKDKERILKSAREKQLVTHKGISIRLWADFSTKPL